jgi:integrase
VEKNKVVAIQPDTAEKAKVERNTKGEGSLFQRGDGYWYFQLVHDGKKYVKSLGTKNKIEAKKKSVIEKRKIIGKIGRNEDAPRTADTVTVGDICEMYIDYAKRNLKSAKDVERMFNTNMKFDPDNPAQSSPAKMNLWNLKASKLGTAELEEYRKRRTIEGVGTATINHELENLRAAYYRAKDHHTPQLVKEVPAFPIDNPDNQRDGFLEDAGYKKILLELPNYAKLVFVLAFHLGCRAGELFKLKWAQVHLSDENLAKGYIDLQKTKNGRDRRAPVYFDMHRWLKWQLDIRNRRFPWCEYVIFHHDASLSNRAKPGDSVVSIRRAWNSAVKRAGYPGLILHDMRRTACRNMVQKAKIPRALAKLISGHLTDSMFDRYNIADPEDVTAIVEDIERWMSTAVETVEPPRLD